MNAKFDWNASKFDKAHFNVFAHFLYLRDGGQVDSVSLFNDVLADDDDDEWNEVSVDINKAHQISDSSHMRLKRKFLNCLTKLAVNKKNEKIVFCIVMKEIEDNVIIWIIRNNDFFEKDKAVFDKLDSLLSELSREHSVYFYQKIVSFEIFTYV